MVFNTLFGWSDYYNYKVSRYGSLLFVHYTDENKMTALMPLALGPLNDEQWRANFLALARALDAHCRKTGMSFEFAGIPDSMVKKLPESQFKSAPFRDCYDYVYKRQDLAELTGRVYAPKRNLIKQFENNKYVYKPLSADNLSDCERFIRGWEVSKVKNDILGTGAYCMACQLMENFANLEITGGVLYVDGKVVAATLASIARDFVYEDGIRATAVVHHENGLTELKGVYQMINWQFAKSLPEDIVYINREEDLGIAGLRKAKLSYNPVFMINKSVVTFVA
jgi:hypothetical protein